MLHLSRILALTRQNPRQLASNQLVLYLTICMVRGGGALAFKFFKFVPTDLSALRLVIADADLQFASATIQNSLPYQDFTGIDKHYCESTLLDPSQPKAVARAYNSQERT